MRPITSFIIKYTVINDEKKEKDKNNIEIFCIVICIA